MTKDLVQDWESRLPKTGRRISDVCNAIALNKGVLSTWKKRDFFSGEIKFAQEICEIIGKTKTLEILLRTTAQNSTLGIWARCEAMVISFEAEKNK